MADNSYRSFKFISPGVFVNEVDNSQLPDPRTGVGPVVIGMAAKGPGMKPVTVTSYDDFVQTFGDPVPGTINAQGYRDNAGLTAPTYGAYAAKAYLRNAAPLTYIRLLGTQKSDATEAGYAGWKAGTLDSTPADGGAWGLFVFPSGSVDWDWEETPLVTTGSLAAVFYNTAGRVMLSGTRVDQVVTGSDCELYESTSDGRLTLLVSKDGGVAPTSLQKAAFTLDSQRKDFMRKVFNTNPTVTNDTLTTEAMQSSSLGGKFWLGESYEAALEQKGDTSLGVLGNAGEDASVKGALFHAMVLPLRNQYAVSQVGNDKRYTAQRSTTGWYIAQDLSATPSQYVAQDMTRLFRLEALSPGASIQNDIKISISNIKAPTGDFQSYGSFSVLIRQISDTDNRLSILERYDEVNLNPESSNYIARVIGDKYEVYNETDRRNRVYGTYDNASNYVRVVVDDELERGGLDPELLPFGVWGAPKYRDVSIISGTGGPNLFGTYASASRGGGAQSMIDGGTPLLFGDPGGYPSTGSVGIPLFTLGDLWSNTATAGIGDLGPENVGYSASIIFPSVPLRGKSTWGTPRTLKRTYWGAWTGRTATNPNFGSSVLSCLKGLASGLETYQGSTALDPAGNTADGADGSNTNATTSPLQAGWIFSLDDIVQNGDATFSYVSGSRSGGTSYSAASGSYTASLNAGLDRFTTLMHGGSDGFDVVEKNPFRNAAYSDSATEKTSYELFSLRSAINMVADPESQQFNVITIPGVTKELVTDYLLEQVEDRADALAVIDLPNVYLPRSDSKASESTRRNYTATQAADALEARNINNSYGAAFVPWLMARDTNTNRNIWVPPSVAALGVLASTDRKAGPWFAPAGFTRGGLSEGAAGLPILDVSARYTSDDRDTLYENNINPIAKFPAEGIVVFGQKTLQQTSSALDRINVRRLMIYLKREISYIASRILFEPNVQTTWDNFSAQARPLLQDVKSRYGIDDFRLELDSKTTTPDLVDRNIIYAKLMVKPTRAAEFFAIDFVVMNSGASFDD